MDNANSKIPNIIYSDGSTTIGQLNVHQDFLDFKVDNEYCVRNPKRFAAYQRAGYSLYLIDNGMEDDFVRYVGLMIKKGSGKKIYWGMDDIPMNDSGSRQFETTLTPQSLSFINQLCNNQKTNGMTDSIIPRYNIIKEYNQNNCNRNMRNKKVVRLTESQLHNIIAESVSQILMEMDKNKYDAARNLHPNLMKKVDPRTFADRAKGVNAFGRQRNDDKRTMQQGGIHAWNNQYGHHGETSNIQGGVDDHHRYDAEMTDGYNVRQRATGSKFINGQLASEYEDINDTERDWGKGDFNASPFADKAQKGAQVANQMRKGSQGQGWRNRN